MHAGELVDDLQRVGRVAVVVGGEDAAGGVDRLRPLGVERPEHDVVEVHAPVAHHAAGVVEEPAEEQVEPVGVERPARRGAEPAVVVDVRAAPRRRGTCPCPVGLMFS